MSYVLKQFNNDQSPVNGRWFAYVNRPGILSTRGLANHMVEHGMTNKADVLAMLAKLSECIPELVAQGYSVKVEGLGVFSAFIANQKGGAPDPSKFNIQEHVKGVRFRFRPDSSDLDNLTSKTFGKHVSLGNGSYVLEKGNKAPKYPLAAYTPQP